MKGIKELKERLKDDREFKNLFASKKDAMEIIDLAREYGYDIAADDVERDEELSEEMLAAVAGGKKDNDIREHNIYS
ncbi:MAG: Nif11-like leader peptide family RiPP precursor [Clostridia bacterium]|nr:Nif11-like leader peptide family RiPP precursor [Clostridia bacterium]